MLLCEAEGNAEHGVIRQSCSGPARLEMGLEGVREAARRDKGMHFTALLHHITPQLPVWSVDISTTTRCRET